MKIRPAPPCAIAITPERVTEARRQLAEALAELRRRQGYPTAEPVRQMKRH